jgi:GNAT superfamily N-acetyltransferase
VTLEVRYARLEDWPAVAVLLAELGRPDVLGTGDEEAARSVYEGFLAQPDTEALVAVDGGRVIGFCDMQYRTRLNFTDPQAWIPDLVVSQRERSRGAGAMLLTRAEALARARGCWSMTLESADWRVGAHAFYRRLGWTDTGKSFTRSLSDRPWPPMPDRTRVAPSTAVARRSRLRWSAEHARGSQRQPSPCRTAAASCRRVG